MRILLTQREMVQRGGSELVAMEVALELQRRGHEITVYSPVVGELGRTLEHYGVPVKADIREVPWEPDVIHGQHHLPTMIALARFTATPAVYHCHGHLAPEERAPLHPHIRVYAAMCQALQDTLAVSWEVPREKITVVPNFVNLERFSQPRTASPVLRRAALFGNNFHPGKDTDTLEALCREQGLTLEKVGAAFGTSHPRPEHLLPEFDLVFAAGKCVMEAIASGCAVICTSHGLGGQLITPENFSRWRDSNFSPRLYSPASALSAVWLKEQLQAYDAAKTGAVCQHLRATCALPRAVDALEAAYQRARADQQRQPGPPGESLDFPLYLQSIGAEIRGLVKTLRTLQTHEAQVSRELEAKNQALIDAHGALASEQEKKAALRRRIEQLTRKLEATEGKCRDGELRWNTAVALLRRGVLGRMQLGRIRRMLEQLLPSKRKTEDEGP